MLHLFEQNLRAHLEHNPMTNVATLPVPSMSSSPPKSEAGSQQPKLVTRARPSNVVYITRERTGCGEA